jgi:hypothetical protein
MPASQPIMNRILLLLGLFAMGPLNAQHYTRDGGIRIGDSFTATIRQHSDDEQALEGLLYIGRGGMTITILKEYFKPALSQISGNLFFMYGFGAHVGYRNMDHYEVFNRTYRLDEWRFTPLLGIDGLVGVEYRFPEFPALISLDMRPYFEYSTIQIFSIYLQSIGISFKYRF